MADALQTKYNQYLQERDVLYAQFTELELKITKIKKLIDTLEQIEETPDDDEDVSNFHEKVTALKTKKKD
jgi:prefoldin subunit 5